MSLYNDVKKNAYYDSVTLMLFSSKITSVKGVKNASVMMGTEHNKELMIKSKILTEQTALNAGANDLVIGILAEDDESLKNAIQILNDSFENKSKASDSSKKQTYKTLESAAFDLKDANIAVISLPGRYAASEAMKALKNKMHVLLFSDNVSLEKEIELKTYAEKNNLLMMGPDCGTAIINGAALGFANVVRKGDIGIVAAAGTGLQEVSVLIDQLCGGISQAIGTGGRDVKEQVGGKTMLMALSALNEDPNTKVIGIVSKPPSKSVMEQVLKLIKTFKKPVVSCFLGGDSSEFKNTDIVFTNNLTDASIKLVCASLNNNVVLNEIDNLSEIVLKEKSLYNENQKYIRGIYSGGSLCFESMLILKEKVGLVYSNLTNDETALPDVEVSKQNSFVDMGDDYFTDGMPHPMIDPRLRVQRIKKEAQDGSVAVILLDCVLGYCSHQDPAGAIAQAVCEAKAENSDRHITYIASVCGTESDFQIKSKQEQKLKDAGIIVTNSNAQAAMLAADILNSLN